MKKIKHRFVDHKIDVNTEILVVGTFNPETPENIADFFYGRQRNFLWTLMPTAFGENSLKGKSISEKLDFIRKHKVDFIDLICEVDVEEVANYEDAYLDSRVKIWTNVVSQLEQLPNIKKVFLTRKSFSGIPKMKIEIEKIKLFCEKKNILFQCLPTPARFYRADKQEAWTKFLNDEKIK